MIREMKPKLRRNKTDLSGFVFPVVKHNRKWKFAAVTREQIFSESRESRPNLDCNYHFSIDLAPIGIVIGAQSIGKY